MLALAWERFSPVPGLKLEWRGPNLITSEWVARHGLTTLDEIPSKIAIIQGPRGEKGEPGITTIIHEGIVPELLDGGNF